MGVYGLTSLSIVVIWLGIEVLENECIWTDIFLFIVVIWLCVDILEDGVYALTSLSIMDICIGCRRARGWVYMD